MRQVRIRVKETTLFYFCSDCLLCMMNSVILIFSTQKIIKIYLVGILDLWLSRLLLCLFDFFFFRNRLYNLFESLLIISFASLSLISVLKLNVPIEQPKIQAESADESCRLGMHLFVLHHIYFLFNKGYSKILFLYCNIRNLFCNI